MSQIIEYSEKVMDHFNNPRNVGEIENPRSMATEMIKGKTVEDIEETKEFYEMSGK